jgi:Anti-sigma-K factor rskA
MRFSRSLRRGVVLVALLSQAAPAYVLPDELGQQVFAAIEREAVGPSLVLRPRPRRLQLLAAVAAVAGAAVLAFVAGTRLDGAGGAEDTVELRSALVAPRGGAEAEVEVRKTGIGRVIRFESDELPILPKGEYYELWFVGPGDTLARPNRISAGTFHPDEDGRSHVRFAAAVDPAKYPVLSVTAEPGDGNPRRTGAEVLRSRPPAAG